MRKIVITVVSFAVLLGAAALPWTGVSQEAKPAAANSTYSIPPAAFTPGSNDLDYFIDYDLYLLSGTDGYFRAPVFLPNGSKFRKIKMLCIDEGASDMFVELRRVNLFTASNSRIGLVWSSGSDSVFRIFSTAALSPRLVNTRKYAYYLRLHFPGTWVDGYRVRGVQIYYDAP